VSITLQKLKEFGAHEASYATEKFGVSKVETWSTQSRNLECFQFVLDDWSANFVHSIFLDSLCTKCTLQKNGVHRLPTPKLLEWTLVHSKTFGVDTCPLQKFGVHVGNFWSAFSLNLWNIPTLQKCVQITTYQLHIQSQEVSNNFAQL
jgi:hypothetical protein